MVNGEDVKKFVLKLAVNAAIDRVIAAIPFLALPFIRPIISWAFFQVTMKVYETLSQVIRFEIIDFTNQHDQTAYTEAKEKLLSAILSGDKNAISKEQENFKSKLSDLIRFRLHQS
jgi:hypothetical protein